MIKAYLHLVHSELSAEIDEDFDVHLKQADGFTDAIIDRRDMIALSDIFKRVLLENLAVGQNSAILMEEK